MDNSSISSRESGSSLGMASTARRIIKKKKHSAAKPPPETESPQSPQFVLNVAALNDAFKKCIAGYHMINSSSVNETIWEDLNALIFTSSGIEVYSKSDGSHLPGMDINCKLGGISNKSAKYATHRGAIDISSYRLTTVCSEKNCGEIGDIVREINARKNFDYYSFIVRDETAPETIHYDWVLIPSNHNVLDPNSYEWSPTIGKRGSKKDTQVGWHTNEINGCRMSITFSMSSQLWIHIEMSEDIKKYIISSTEVNKKPMYDYIKLFENSSASL